MRQIKGEQYQNTALTYTLTGEAFGTGPFAHDATTGWISLKSGKSLDYETKSTYSGKLAWVVQGQTASVNITINVTDLEAGKPGTPTVTRTEFSEPTDPALDVTWTAPTLTGEPTNPLRITGYEAQYRKKAAEGKDPAAWTAYSGTLGATATTFRLSGLTAGATYEAQVRAIAGVEGPGSWSDTGEGTANRAPAATSASFSGGTFPVGTVATYSETGQGAVGVLFSDADGDALTYSAAAQHPALLGVSLSGAAGSAQLRVTLLNQGSSKVTYTARDAYGGSVTRTTTIGITAKVSRSIAEHSPAGTAVGTPVTGTPYNGAALTYSLAGKASSSGLFVINSATGQISVATGATLDYETDDSDRETEIWNGQVIAKFYRGKVNYTVDGHAAAIDVIIKVTDIGSPKPATPTVTRTTFSEPTDPALDVTWTAPTGGGLTITGYKAQYRKKAAAGQDPAAWTAYSGTLGATATTFNLAGLDAGATYEAQVRAVTSQEGESAWSDTGEGTANRAPAATSASFSGGTFPVGTVATYAETGQGAVGVLFSDADSDALTYSAAAQHPALLGVSLSGDAGSAQLRVTLLNQGSSKVTYTARDAYGGSVTRTTTIGITAKVSRSIVEHSPAGTAVGAPVTGTPYNGTALTYSLTGKASSSGLFVIDSATGQISVATGATLDYDTDDTYREIEYYPPGVVFAKFYRGKVNYTVDSHAAAIEVLIKVTENTAPVITAPRDTTYAQGESVAAFDVTVTDADGDTPTVTVTGLPSGLSYASGQVSGAVAQDAAVQDYTVTIGADDGVNDAVTATFTITVTDVSFAPAITDPGNKSYAQGASITAFAITVTDADGDTPTVTVTGLPTGLLYASGQVSGTVAQDAAVQDYTVTISADDGTNDAVTETFTITVTDVSFAPVITDPGNKTYAQGASITAFDITVTDPDGDTPTVTVTGLPSGLAYASGQVSGTVAQDAAVQDHTVTISADDGTNDAVTETFTVTVTDVSFAPTITDPGNKTVAQGASITAFDITVTDADGDTPTVTVTGLPSGLAYASGQVSGTVAQDAAVQDHTVTISADDGTNDAVTETFTVTVTDVSFAPTITDPGNKTVAQGASITAFDISATDADGDTPTVTVTGLPSGLAYASGQVSGTVAQDAVVKNHTVTISADDGTNDAVTEKFTITVTDVNFAPAITDPGDKTYAQGASITAFDITVTDADGDTPTVTVTGLPSGLSYTNGQVSGTVAQDAAVQDHTVTISADDRTNDAVTETFTVTVTDVSFAPVITDPGDRTYAQGASITAFAITVTDADGDTPTVTVTGLPSGLSYTNGQVSGTVAQDAVLQDYTVTITANDGTHADVTETFTITVSDVSFAPVITDPGDRTYAQGASVTAFDVTVTDADGDTPTVTVTGLPSGLSYTNGQVSGTVAQDAAVQDHTVTITANDGAHGDVTETFTITVTDVSFAPVITDPGDKTYAQGASITAFDITVTDADGDTPTVTVTALPSGLSYTNGQVSGTVAQDAAVQDHTVTISADDGTNDAVTETFVITVTDESFAPAITDPGDKTYAQGASITAFAITVTDADGDTPTVTVTGLPSGLAYASGQVSGTVAQDAAVQDHTVTITADDGVNADVTETFTITVTDEKFAPVIADPGDKTYAQGASITAFAITVTDADGDTPTITVTGLPSGLTYASGQVGGTVSEDAAGGDHTVTITANDGTHADVTETFTITVTQTIILPVTTSDSTTVYVSIYDPEGPAAEGTSAHLPVRLTSSVGGTVEVPWTTSNSAPASKIGVASGSSVGDGQSGHEHEPSSGTVTLAAGQTEAIIEIRILDDEEHEDPESFGIDLGEPSVAGGASQKVVVDRGSAKVTILDDDAPPVFDDGDAAVRTVAENTPPGTAIGTPISATDAEDDPLSYTLGGTDATAFRLDSATGQLSTKDSLDFEVRNTYDGLTVTVDDGHGHTDELSLTVNVTDVSPPDAPDAPSVAPSSSDPTGSLDVSWTAPADNGGPIADYDVRYRDAGTAAWRDHVFDGAGARTTIAGLRAATTYEVQVLARNGEGAGGWSDSGRGATLDPSVLRETVTIADADAVEGEALTFTVTLNRTVLGGLTVTPVYSGGTADAGADYTENNDAIRFTGTAGEEHVFAVLTIEDEVVENNETFAVALSVSNAPSGVTVGDPATGTIQDDDGGGPGGTPTATIGDANASGHGNSNGGTNANGNANPGGTADPGRNAKAFEGDALTFKVTLNRAVQGGLTLTPVFSDGTATSGIDYTANASPLRFSGKAGEAHTFTVATTEDEDVEENETFTVGLRVSNAPSGVTAGNPATGTIIDDDGQNEPPGFEAGQATTRTVAENTPAGGAVGDPVEAVDPNGDALSYTLSGSDAFAIDQATGQITVSQGASLDYESGPLSYAVTVAVNDGREGSAAIEVAIAVTDAAEPPAAPAAPDVAGASLTSIQVDWRTPANTGPPINDYDVRYRKEGAPGWTSHAFTGTQTSTVIHGLEFEATYNAQVRAKNAEGTSAWSPSGTGRTRINTAPVAVDDVVTVFRGRRTTSLRNADTRNDARNPSVQPPEDFDVPEPDAGAKIAPLANSAAASESDDGRISVLANDVDAEDDRSQLTAILVAAPAHGALTLYENGTFVYNHDGSRVAEDRFTYRVLDSRGASSGVATVTISITGINLGPAVVGSIPDQVLTLGKNGAVDLTGLFVDPDGDPLNYEASSNSGSVNVSLVGKVIALTPVALATTRVSVTARDPYGLSAKLSFAVTVENLQTNRARVLELSLAAFGRTVLSQAVDAIAGRFEATSRALRATLGGSKLGIGKAFNAVEWVRVAAGLFGIRLDAPVSASGNEAMTSGGLSRATSDPNAVRPILRAPDGRGVLTRSSFQLAMDPTGSAENGWTLWGRGAGSRYAGDSRPDNRTDGSVTAAYVGADYRWDSKLVMGLALSYSNGMQDFNNASESTGKWKTRLTSLRPYVHWSPTGKLGLWGMFGLGRGDAELNSGYGGPLAGTGSSTVETDVSSRSAALGGRMELTRVGNVDVALTADAFAVSTSSEAVAGLRAATGDARRVRMMVNGSTDWSVTPDSRMNLRLALGARVDGGDAETGLGAEMAGVLSFSNRRIGLDLEVGSHWLLAHQDRNFREGGLSLALRLDPGADNKGLALFLEPEWGKNAASGVESTWNGERMSAYRDDGDAREALDWRPRRARAGLDYGLETWGGRRLAPFVELDVAGAGIRRLGGGLRLNVPGSTNWSAGVLSRDLQLELLGEFRLPGHGTGMGGPGARVGTRDYRVGLSLFRNF